MKLSMSLLLPYLACAASAGPDLASVYIFQQRNWISDSTSATLTPEQARLVLAQRLDISKYHNLADASKETLSYINSFGRHTPAIFEDATADSVAAELVVVIDNDSGLIARELLRSWEMSNPAFYVSSPPSVRANQELVADLSHQCEEESGTQDKNVLCDLEEAITPSSQRCWKSKSKILHLNLVEDIKGYPSEKEFIDMLEKLKQSTEREEMNVVMVIMPKSARPAEESSQSYGSYELPPATKSNFNRRQAEEPMAEETFASLLPIAMSQTDHIGKVSNATTSYASLKGPIPFCHASVDACVSATNNCSGHGSCFGKYNSTDGKSGCYTCGCVPTIRMVGRNNQSIKTTSWGGAACNKKDISGAFWLLAGFSVVLMGIVGASIGMLFSIGEEKLPGVIGAGVSSKTR